MAFGVWGLFGCTIALTRYQCCSIQLRRLLWKHYLGITSKPCLDVSNQLTLGSRQFVYRVRISACSASGALGLRLGLPALGSRSRLGPLLWRLGEREDPGPSCPSFVPPWHQRAERPSRTSVGLLPNTTTAESPLCDVPSLGNAARCALVC